MLKFLQTAKILEFQNFGKMHNGVQKSAKKIDFAYKTQVSLLNNFSNRLTICVKFNCKKNIQNTFQKSQDLIETSKPIIVT